MGRSEDDKKIDVAKLLYPAMQAVDIHSLDVDIAHAGMDQRKIHMLVRARNMWAHQSTVSNYDMLLIADVVQRIIYDAMIYLTDRCPSLSREPFTQRLLIIQRLYFESLVNQGRSLESAMQVNQQNLQHASGNLAHIPQPVPMRGYDPRNNMDVW